MLTSPPGFPTTPQHQGIPSPQEHDSPHLPVSLYDEEMARMMSPITANTKMLDTIFNSADVAPNNIRERAALFDCDVNGDIEVDDNGNNNYYLSEGYIYRSGHGREKCSMDQCLYTGMNVPNNCGFHQQFYFPVHYKPCGLKCKGGFCSCMRKYPDY